MIESISAPSSYTNKPKPAADDKVISIGITPKITINPNKKTNYSNGYNPNPATNTTANNNSTANSTANNSTNNNSTANNATNTTANNNPATTTTTTTSSSSSGGSGSSSPSVVYVYKNPTNQSNVSKSAVNTTIEVEDKNQEELSGITGSAINDSGKSSNKLIAVAIGFIAIILLAYVALNYFKKSQDPFIV
jgi:cobalamin biosynthesis Mg chelatase CobN